MSVKNRKRRLWKKGAGMGLPKEALIKAMQTVKPIVKKKI